MPEAEKVLAIADLVLGCCVVLEGIVAIIWTFDTVFQLAIFVIGCYQIFFGLAVALLALRGWELVTTNAAFMTKNGGKLFAYTFLSGLSIILVDASWFAVILMIFTCCVAAIYIPLTFVPSMTEYKAGHVLGGGAAPADAKTENPAAAAAPPANAV
mmetsp:Transcript_82015/g.167096  ORF Transcript_82015/g.167096 Transcript_82015/m.167096 type:complete len:156 (+) Transcript_82015:111-578(+)